MRDLDALVGRRNRTATIVGDDGTEMTSCAVPEWTNRSGVDWHYIAPDKPLQNGFVERLNLMSSAARSLPAAAEIG